MIRLKLESGGPDRAGGGTLVVGLFEGERPPKGEAGWADWRLGGSISRAILAGRVDGKAGSCLLMPAAKLPAKRILLMGLGSPADFKGKALAAAIDLALSKLKGLQETRFAMALPGDKPHPPPKDSAEVIGERLLRSMASAARQANVTVLGPNSLLDELREWVRTAGDPVATHVQLEDYVPPFKTEAS